MNSRDGFIGRAIVNRPIPLHTYHSMFLLIPIHYILSFSIILFSGLFVFSSFLVSYFSAYFFLFLFLFFFFAPLFFPFSISSVSLFRYPASTQQSFKILPLRLLHHLAHFPRSHLLPSIIRIQSILFLLNIRKLRPHNTAHVTLLDRRHDHVVDAME